MRIALVETDIHMAIPMDDKQSCESSPMGMAVRMYVSTSAMSPAGCGGSLGH